MGTPIQWRFFVEGDIEHHLLRRAANHQVEVQGLFVQQLLQRRGQHLAGFHKIRELVQAERRTLRAPVVESPKKRLPVGVSNGIETLIPDCNRHGQETPLGGFFRTVRHKIDIVFLQDAL